MRGDGWTAEDCDGWQDAPRPEDDRSTRVDHGPTDDELDRMDAAIASHYADESDGMGTSPQTAALLGDAATETARAIRAERRAAYLDGVPDEHHPEL
ncbi:hypothetical protein SEA_FIZZLES_81 [Microbacterium phage Fizzles]|nr:hypothetical protein SEA_FIZZLES_81 [Microbacterium phage Fizzles]